MQTLLLMVPLLRLHHTPKLQRLVLSGWDVYLHLLLLIWFLQSLLSLMSVTWQDVVVPVILSMRLRQLLERALVVAKPRVEPEAGKDVLVVIART